MKKVLSIIAALTIVTSLTACGSGTQPEPSSAALPQTATEAATENENAAQIIDPFEGVNISSNGNYPDMISVNLDIDESLFKGHPTLYNKTILSADSSGMKIEVSFDKEAMQSFLSENNYEISEEKKIYDLPVDQMQSAALLNKNQLENCKSDLLKRAKTDVDSYLQLVHKEDLTYQLKNCIALFPPENTVFAENTSPDQIFTDLDRTPNPNIIFGFECSDGTGIVAYRKAYLDNGSISAYLNSSQTVFMTYEQSSYEESVNYIESVINDLDRKYTLHNDSKYLYEKVEFSID